MEAVPREVMLVLPNEEEAMFLPDFDLDLNVELPPVPVALRAHLTHLLRVTPLVAPVDFPLNPMFKKQLAPLPKPVITAVVKSEPARRMSMAALIANQLQSLVSSLRGIRSSPEVQAPAVKSPQPAIKIILEGWKVPILFSPATAEKVSTDTPVAALRHLVADQIKIEPSNITLAYTGKILKDKFPLSFYGVRDKSVLALVVREMHDNPVKPKSTTWRFFKRSSSSGSHDEKTVDLEALEKNFALETSDLPDLVSLEADEKVDRFKMPCGHAITSESLQSLCDNQMNGERRVHEFTCPGIKTGSTEICNEIWHYPIVRKVAKLTDVQARIYERKLNENFLKTMETQWCPECSCNLIREAGGEDAQAQCTVCGPNTRTFCWKCTTKWADVKNKKYCGNPDCDTSGKLREEVLQILASCDLKRVGQVDGVPSVRGCPNCAKLIFHIDACKHIHCNPAYKGCNTHFCFVCLSTYKPQGGGWSCGSSGDVCPTKADRQTENLPNKTA